MHNASREAGKIVTAALTPADLLERAKGAIEAGEHFVYDIAAEHGQMVDNVGHMGWFVEAVANYLIDNTRRWSRLPHFG